MTIALLALVSLFVLVATSRPILSGSEPSDFAPTSSTLQTAVQAVFRIHPGHDDLRLDTARFQKPKQQVKYLSELDEENLASFNASPGVKAPLEPLLDKNADVIDANNALDDARADLTTDDLPTLEPVVNDRQETPTDETSNTPLVVLAFSCLAAFLALACVTLMLYIIKALRSQMLASKRAWELLPRFWKYSRTSAPQENTRVITKERLLGGDRLLLRIEVDQQCLFHAERSVERHDLRTEDKPLYFDAVSDMESEWDDVDEKYQDALDMTPLPLMHDLPLDEHQSLPSHFGNPPSLSSESYPPDQPISDRSAPLMREVCSPRPAWSVRAIDSPMLGLSSREGGDSDSTPQPFIHPRRRAYRSAIPDFDIALAMQLRPGLGLGADSAWMVRFLMAIFGWFAVALTGNTQSTAL